MRDRHPVLENLVFGLAGLLALILAYYAYGRWSASRSAASYAPRSEAEAPSDQAPSDQAASQDDDAGGAVGFSGSGSVPTVRFSQPKAQPKRRGKK